MRVDVLGTVLVVIALVTVVASLLALARSGPSDEPATTVRYRVPSWQDPAWVLVALRGAGHEAVPDHTPTGIELVIPCPDEAARAAIRTVIRDHAGLKQEDPAAGGSREVRFADE